MLVLIVIENFEVGSVGGRFGADSTCMGEVLLDLTPGGYVSVIDFTEIILAESLTTTLSQCFFMRRTASG